MASLSGTTLEWYGFVIYSAAAAIVFGRLGDRVGRKNILVLLRFAQGVGVGGEWGGAG